MMAGMLTLIITLILTGLLRGVRSHRALVLENLALRHQLAVLQRTAPRPRLRRFDRLFWALLSRLWHDWAEAVVIVQPENSARGSHELRNLVSTTTSVQDSTTSVPPSALGAVSKSSRTGGSGAGSSEAQRGPAGCNLRRTKVLTQAALRHRGSVSFPPTPCPWSGHWRHTICSTRTNREGLKGRKEAMTEGIGDVERGMSTATKGGVDGSTSPCSSSSKGRSSYYCWQSAVRPALG
jgi:hypothetical protein